VGNAEGGCYWL
jgi:hypothetical protein